MTARERMQGKEVREGHERRVCERLIAAGLRVRQGMSVDNMFSVFEYVLAAVADKLVRQEYIQV